MRSKFKDFIGDISIRYKVFLSYLIILFFVSGIVIIVNSIITTRDIRQNTQFSAEKALQQTKAYIEFRTSSTKNVLNIVSIDNRLLEILDNDESYYRKNPGAWAVDSDDLQKILFSTRTTPDIEQIMIYMPSSLASIYENEEFINLNKYKDSTWYKTLESSSNKVQWFTDEDFNDPSLPSSVIAMKKIPIRNNYSRGQEIIRMDFLRSSYDSLLDQAIVTENTYVMIISPNHIMSTSTNIDSVNEEKSMDEIVTYVNSIKGTFPQWSTRLVNGKKVILGIETIASNDWKLVMIVPNEDITKTSNESKYKLFFIFLFIVPFTMPLAFIVASSITSRIALLIKRIREVDSANFNHEIGANSKDEVGILTKNFNYMLLKTSMLLDEKYAMGKEIKNMELKALQAQINPHFLYNTLDLLYLLGVKHNIPMISDLVLQLSQFYKLSLSKGKDLVTIASELNHIEAFVKIQNYRFNDAFKLIIDIPHEFLDVEIPKITLQPIIENSILHGILETVDESGTITISAHSEGNNLIIDITDDGVGIDDETLDLLNKKIVAGDEQHGYGLNNIDDRLKLVFGSEYGLKYSSILAKCTTVSIKIPLPKADS